MPIYAEPNTATFASGTLSAMPIIQVGKTETCLDTGQVRVFSIDWSKGINFFHYLSAGSVCLSRALNDTPKIAALLIAADWGNSLWKYGLVAIAMVAGGLFNSRKVAETMSKRVTDLNPVQGLSANLVTSFLVLFASKLGVPVSTTHVSCGSIFGIGLVNRSCRWKTMAEITSAWVATLPLAALIGGLFCWLFSHTI